jgi:CIC family chloride channel protein
MFVGWNLEPGAFGLVGMGAFLAAATGAPVMAIIMIFELSLNYQILMPIMLAAVLSHHVSRSIGTRSLYGEALKRKGQASVSIYLATLKVGDLMRAANEPVNAEAGFGDVAKAFLQSRRDFLSVVESGRFIGTILLHDIKPYLDQPDLESVLIAKDVMREETCSLAPEQTLDDALRAFGQAESECLPVLDKASRLLGNLTKTDVLLFLAGSPRTTEA